MSVASWRERRERLDPSPCRLSPGGSRAGRRGRSPCARSCLSAPGVAVPRRSSSGGPRQRSTGLTNTAVSNNVPSAPRASRSNGRSTRSSSWMPRSCTSSTPRERDKGTHFAVGLELVGDTPSSAPHSSRIRPADDRDTLRPISWNDHVANDERRPNQISVDGVQTPRWRSGGSCSADESTPAPERVKPLATVTTWTGSTLRT